MLREWKDLRCMAIAGLTGASSTRFANEKRPGKGERPREPAPDDGTGTGTIDRIPEPTESMLEALWHQEWLSFTGTLLWSLGMQVRRIDL